VKITADKGNNALVVTASPTDWLTLKDVIYRLDIPREQVFVEGLIVETNVN
jgi:general secretion pathway protein D